MLLQTGRKKLHVKLFFSALFVISITAIIFGSVKSFAESHDGQANSIIAASKAEKRRPQFEPSRRLPKQISRESKLVFEETRTNNFLEILASGDLDTTFGTGGKVTTPVGNSTSEAFAVAVQADGKFVAAGYSSNASNRDFALVRYDANGTPDTSFGTGGKVTTDIGGDNNEILAIAIQAADGKIIVAGYSSNGANDDFTIARYNPNGTLDAGFGTGGIVKTNFNNAFDYAEALVIQTDGKIVAAGSSFNGSFYDFALARYNSDGSPDASFDGDGSLTTDFAGGDDLAFSLAMQPDGKLVAAGVANTDFGLARYNSNGSLDTTFDADGKVSTTINTFDAAYAVAIQADGKIVAAGETDAGTNSDFALVRYNADGALDTTFDADGKISTPIGSGNEFAEALTIQSGGKIIAAGHSFNGAGNADFALVRYNADGALDLTFGTGGKATTDFGTSANDFAAGLALQSNSRVIAVGSSNLNFAVAAYVLETPTCSYALDPTSAQIPVAGGSGSFNVATTAGCNWTATTNDSWITVTAGNTGSGNGTVSYSVQANTGPARTGTIVVNGQIFTINQASGCSYMLSANSQDFPANGGSGSFNVSTSAGCTWTAQTSDNWITITGGNSGSGNGTVTFTVAANTGAARTGTITAAGLTFTVNQASGCSYSLSATSSNFPSAGGNDSVNVIAGSGCAWTATSNVNWISITDGSSGNGNGTVTFNVQFNTGPERTGTLTIAGQTYTVTQANGCTFAINPTGTTIPAAGGNSSFNVLTANSACGWTATTNDSWISITAGSGTGNGSVSFTVQANPGPQRTGTITVGGQTFTITQTGGCSYSLSSNSANFPNTGGTGNFNINTAAACQWTAVSNVSWITITGGATGTGNGTVSFSVQANTGPERSGTITAGGQIYTVTQANGCTFTLAPTSNNFTAAGGSGSFAINPSNAGCQWTAASNNPWITITSGGSGTGAGTISFTVQANVGVARTGTITAGGQTFTINQASGCTFSLSATSASLPPAGGSGSVNVTAGEGCAWTAVSNADWITVTSGASGSGNGTVSFNVAANNGPDRSGTITIAGQTFTVNQGLGCSYSLSPSSATIPAAGGSGSFNVSSGAGCNWTATTGDSWISITGGASGSGNGTVTFTAQANTGTNRTGTITVNGQTFTVNQASGCTYTLPINSASVPRGPGTGSFTINSGAGCAWTATSNASWISITSGSSGTGNGTVGYSYQGNPGVSRTGTITAGGQTFTIIQANGCVFIMKPQIQNFTAAGGTGSFDLIASDSSCPWNAVSLSLPWLTVTGASSGTGNGTVSFNVAVNTGTARAGNIIGPIGPFNTALTFTVNQAAAVVNRKLFDYDGDGRADLSVFRPSTGSWYISRSSDNGFVGVQFGANGDLIAPADFDGDGKTDICVFRPSDGGWYRLNSSNNTFTPAQFGTNGDLPVPGDFDGDGKADLTVYRPSTGSWYRINSSDNQFVAAQFGIAEDKPLVGDFDGDGKSDLTVFRPSNGTWYRINSATDTFSPAQFGAPGDLPVAADYDGDGRTDLAVYRPSVGDWYWINSSNSSFTGLHFGVTEDKPAPADFDGDGKADLVVFRPSSGTWYLLRTTAGFTGFQFGTSGDIPTPNAFVR